MAFISQKACFYWYNKSITVLYLDHMIFVFYCRSVCTFCNDLHNMSSLQIMSFSMKENLFGLFLYELVFVVITEGPY